MKTNKNEHVGVIYILTNPSFPEYVKIGYATDIEKRLKQLNKSETIPYAFRVYAVYEVNSELTDKELHKLIDILNPDLRAIDTFAGKKRVKEFYAMSSEDAYKLLESIAKISGTNDRLKRLSPEGHELKAEREAEDVKENAKKGPFRFSQCDIPINSTICFVDDKTIEATVVDDSHIEYKGVTTSLSALAKELKKYSHAPQGPKFFTYNGKILDDIRKEKESNQ